jgi:hypothetical protein
MSGPIVRTGTTPQFWENWDRAFGGEKPAAGAKKKSKKKVANKKAAKARGKK